MSATLTDPQLTTTPEASNPLQGVSSNTSPALSVGDRVCVRSDVRPESYAGRVGTVTEIRQVSPSAVEIGLAFTAGHVVTWFRPAELERADRS